MAACLDLLTSALRLFGAKVMDVKRLMKVIPPQFDHRDKTVREGAKGLVVELYRWLGPALKPNLETNLKPVQVCKSSTCTYIHTYLLYKPMYVRM